MIDDQFEQVTFDPDPGLEHEEGINRIVNKAIEFAREREFNPVDRQEVIIRYLANELLHARETISHQQKQLDHRILF